MKAVKIVLGTVLALASIFYAVQFVWTLICFIRVWTLTGDWAQGLSQTGGALFVLMVAVCFTIWTFQSAFRKPGSENQESRSLDEVEVANRAKDDT